MMPAKRPIPPKHEPILQRDREETFEMAKDINDDSEYIIFPPNSVKLIWPVKSNQEEQYKYDIVSVYMDHDNRISSVKDYTCGKQSYDLLDGYNHLGTDIMPWPFSWDLMEKEIITVISAADGIIVGKSDGNYDKNCDINSNGDANNISIMHKDGSITMYYHLKNGSLTNKSIGEEVKQGEKIGLIGSSGMSTGPHLHFELHDSYKKPTDPFGGPCSGKSWWEDQKPYYKTSLMHMLTHHRYPIIPECPRTEIIFDTQNFYLGDSIVLSAFFNNVKPYTSSSVEILSTSGKLFKEFEIIPNDSFLFYPWFETIKIPETAEPGKWTYTIELSSKKYSHNFFINNTKKPIDEDMIQASIEDEITLVVNNEPIDIYGREFICQTKNKVYFAHDSDSLNAQTIFVLSRVAEYLIENDMNDIKVTGYASSIGSREYNRKLSKRRSHSVAKYFQEYGINVTDYIGKGESQIVRDAYGQEIESKSRRVEICYRR